MSPVKKSTALHFLKDRSNIDYFYYHLWDNEVLDLDFTLHGFTRNYIVYILNSHLASFHKFFSDIQEEYVTDFFLEDFEFCSSQDNIFFEYRFQGLFWLKFSSVHFPDYSLLCHFLEKNKLDLNRLFIDNSSLNTAFLMRLKKINNFGNLTFINFDNNLFVDEDVDHLIDFMDVNYLNLEYLSLVNNQIGNIGVQKLVSFLGERNTSIRILDLSSNNFDTQVENTLTEFVISHPSLRELYLRNIPVSDTFITAMIESIEKQQTKLYCIKMSLSPQQLSQYKNTLETLSSKYSMVFDVDELGTSPEKFYTTIYFKEFPSGSSHIHLCTLSDNFYFIDAGNEDKSYHSILENKHDFLRNGVNLFLFDVSHYNQIYYLLETYNFNYIYLENYHISDEDFVNFIEKIRSLPHKKYKINLNSISINYFQLDYLIKNIPENIFYIEVTLNEIEEKREIYIIEMLKNPAFVFENMEIYQKIFI